MQRPASGQPLHTRSLTVGIRGGDAGRWRAHGEVVDLRKRGFIPMLSDLQPAGIIHHMTIDLELDPGSGRIESIDVTQPHVAVEPSQASRGECCRDPAPRLQSLVGDVIDSGFARRLATAFGGPLGCSHLLTLFQLMASAVLRAVELEGDGRTATGQRAADERFFQRAVFLDGHERPDESIGLSVQLSDFHFRAGAEVTLPLDRLAGLWEVQLHACVSQGTRALGELFLAERSRDAASLAQTAWRDLAQRVGPLEGVPIFPGLGRRLVSMFGNSPGDRLLLDTALQLAPGHVQVMAAAMDRWISQRSSSSTKRSNEVPKSSLPDVANIGGMPDSCYMWRSDGALTTARSEREDKA